MNVKCAQKAALQARLEHPSAVLAMQGAMKATAVRLNALRAHLATSVLSLGPLTNLSAQSALLAALPTNLGALRAHLVQQAVTQAKQNPPSASIARQVLTQSLVLHDVCNVELVSLP